MPAGRIKRSRGPHFVHSQRRPFIELIIGDNLLPIIVIAQNSFDIFFLSLHTVTVSGAEVLRLPDTLIMCLRVSDNIDAMVWVKNA